MEKNKQSLLLFILFSLFICSCDLFTGPKEDLFKKIGDEVDWANAPRLAVRVEHPNTWGVSNPTGNITPAKDIRKGYAFEIEFTPDQAYSLEGWRAYRSASMPQGWMTDTTLLDNLERLDGVSVEVPNLPARGGAGSFKINTTEPVTLVPWCKTEPYVTRTNPRNSPQMLYPRGTDIVIYFNAPLNLTPDVPLSVLFTEEKIKITADGTKISEDDTYYNYPVYAANNDLGAYTITITASDVPGDSLIEVTAGPEFYNAAGEKMAKAEVFSFSTSPAAGGGGIDSWGASYNESAGSITVNWTIKTTGTVEVAARYRVNQGGDNPLVTTDAASVTKTISSVSRPDASGVRDGRSVNNINEYEVFLDLYIEGIKSNAGSVSFKVWNIPGMNITHDNTVLLDNGNIGTALVAGNDSKDKNFILTEDIILDAPWLPVGTTEFVYYPDNASSPWISHDNGNGFYGKFYGNGHTITVSGGFDNDEYSGIFGYAQNAEIRDLTVNYTANVTVRANSYYPINIGGVTGYISGSSQIRNTIVKGIGLSITCDDYYGDISAGAITGSMEATASIENCFTNINLSETNGYYIRAGGIVGHIENTPFTGGADKRLMINGVTVKGAVSVITEDSLFVYMGGVVGECQGLGTIKNATASGNIEMDIGKGYHASVTRYICGGVIGKMQDGIMDSCYFTGIIKFPKNMEFGGSVYVGGLAGVIGFFRYSAYPDSEKNEGTVKVKASNASGNLSLYNNSEYYKIHIGGISAYINSSSKGVILENCEYLEGNIEFTGYGYGNIYMGGFTGEIEGMVDMVNCGSRAGSINLTTDMILPSGSAVGGFAGIYKGEASGCYSISPIEIKFSGYARSGNDSLFIGGFAGQIINYSDTGVNWEVSKCYASGSIEVFADSDGVHDWVQYINVGGFVGGLQGSYSGVVTVKDCYALGNIMLDRSGEPKNYFNNYEPAPQNYEVINAGGFAGFIKTGCSVYRCFSAGFVMAQAISTGTSLNVGGIAGSVEHGFPDRHTTISDCAALAPFFTIKGSADGYRAIGRICLARIYEGNVTLNNNYACAAFLEDSATYGDLNPSTTASPITNAHDDKDGLTVAASTFNDRSFWTNKLGFDNSRWNFSGIGSRGYPLLVGVGGQQ